MTAGNVDVASRPETELFEPDETADWKEAGSGVTVTELNLDNQLEALRDPNNPLPIDQVEGNLEGALGVNMSLTGNPSPAWHDLVFDDGALPTSGGRAPTSEWAIGLDYIGGKVERHLKGVIVTEVSLQWQQGQQWTVDLTMLYGDEEKNTSFTPTDVVTADASNVYNFAATDVHIDTVEVLGLSSMTLSISDLARFRRGTGRKPYEAVIGPVTPTLDIQADFTEESPSHLELAYGDANAPVDTGEVDTASIDIDVTNRSGGTHSYEIGAAKPATYGWEDLTESDADEQESITFNIFDDGDGAVVVA